MLRERLINRDAGDRVSEELKLVELRRTLENVRSLAGKPEREESRWLDGQRCTALFYRFPEWPEFDFEIVGESSFGLWVDAGFVRRADSELPRVESPGELRVWKHLVGEVRDRFGPLQEADLWPPYEQYVTEHRGVDGVPRQYSVQFSWRLLQRTSELEGE
ncbi:hypothetical protein SAMN05421805_12196 [Saccharopolyspora antimicrobica]|uniref:Uncharacterized protein n=1 Tax=Saccharopolyspora antimicrobica TaxID=455193 RepID=A0A1I5J744_9PSEU|nr:hypothetical protein [Saccharopolyspora antimicrobica]RKT82057.1 hypothetical protein ATL45_0298 [Saccharopolyspora antimicrobica]SFO68440.1 hypothetical protein SAMN05421805_12196 [Saccharopolyspora antimicrobica]